MCGAIERESEETEVRGKSFFNLKNVPNGHYTVHYVRIGQPLSQNSRLKVLGKAKGILVNIDRSKLEPEPPKTFKMNPIDKSYFKKAQSKHAKNQRENRVQSPPKDTKSNI